MSNKIQTLETFLNVYNIRYENQDGYYLISRDSMVAYSNHLGEEAAYDQFVKDLGVLLEMPRIRLFWSKVNDEFYQLATKNGKLTWESKL